MKAILIKVADADLDRWRGRAKASGMTLSAWIRLQCGATQPAPPTAFITEVTMPNVRHTATSDYRTCLCSTCTNKRKTLGIA